MGSGLWEAFRVVIWYFSRGSMYLLFRCSLTYYYLVVKNVSVSLPPVFDAILPIDPLFFLPFSICSLMYFCLYPSESKSCSKSNTNPV